MVQALAALCATEVVSYGVLYYAFPVLAAQITAGTGWSRTAITAAYSAGNLAGALAGIPAGRLLYRHGPRPVMTAASVLGAASVAGIAAAPSYAWFLAAWLAAVLAVITVPAHALALRPPWTARHRGQVPAAPARDRQVLGSRAFVQLVTAATLCAFAQYAALVNLVPLLTGRGMTAGLAAWALGLGGAGQVAGRLCYRPLYARLGARGMTVAVIAAGAAATLLLGLLPGPAALLVTASVIAGAVRGVFTLTEATLVADYWGPGRYATLNGVFNAPLTAAAAPAPARQDVQDARPSRRPPGAARSTRHGRLAQPAPSWPAAGGARLPPGPPDVYAGAASIAIRNRSGRSAATVKANGRPVAGCSNITVTVIAGLPSPSRSQRATVRGGGCTSR